jgi:lysosomal acid lipase/cholesteryl ester hydrolase
MGNNRGNIYSDTHTNLMNDTKEFWEFDFEDMGIYDLPAEIEFIL